MSKNGKEQDLWLEHPIGGMKKLQLVSGMKTRAPKIAWGSEYLSWPVEKRLSYAERLASTMNHAADILQIQSNDDKQIIAKQEKLLKHHVMRYQEQGDLMHKELTSQDAEKQILYTEIVKLKNEIKALKKGKDKDGS